MKSKQKSIDPKEVIQYACDWAETDEERRYVVSNGRHFVAQASQPPHTQSHWMYIPNVQDTAGLYAHVYEPGDADYHYEAV